MARRKRSDYRPPSRRARDRRPEQPARPADPEPYFPPGTFRTVLRVGGTVGVALIALVLLLSLR